MVVIYIDGIFDLFHYGHLESFRKCKELYENVVLKVGVISDTVATDYKRKPIICEKHRYESVRNSKYVDEVIENSPLIITKEFMEANNINIVVHGFSNSEDENNQSEFFEYPLSINAFIKIDYCKEISTTEIIKRIKLII
uniref:choline-phosphate cytidylyltransferase n=1 Tax=Megaviridae environmental sample TaxID=1737588 RepID=A0A5J6VJG7_9VIRU|nr:MAG: cytidylyltransferase-like protein [Megaviridae environmental sample]